jgi:hypothetical protein
MSPSFEDTKHKKICIRAYLDKGVGTQNAKRFNEDLARLHNVVLTATLVVYTIP